MSEDHYLTKALKLNWKPYVPALRLRPFVLPLQFASFQFQKDLFQFYELIHRRLLL